MKRTTLLYKEILYLLIFSCLPMYSEELLVELSKINSHITINLIYATSHNFTGKQIYKKTAKAYLIKEAAHALSNVQNELETMGLGLVVWDAYRPVSAQQKLWDVCAQKYPDPLQREKYVSNPAKGGRHTRGTSVDLTLKELKTGKLLEMGTQFDHFGIEAWHSYTGAKISKKAKENRVLLAHIMEKHGFKRIVSEWWHYDYKNWEQHEPQNVEI